MRVAHTLVRMYAPIDDATLPNHGRFLGGPGVADIKGDVGATRDFRITTYEPAPPGLTSSMASREARRARGQGPATIPAL
jgi:hypothetical protein